MSKPNTTWIADWNPDDAKFWQSTGKSVARRNLIWSIVAEHVGFSIWLTWSIVATKLPQAGFHFTTDQLFQLVALPGLIGSLMRFPYTFAVTTFGGRNWTIFSASVLFIPTIALAYFVTKPDTPYAVMLAVAALAGLGGGNFASSMTNISFFYPDRMKGWALGLNAAGGNIGVSQRAIADADRDGARHRQSLSGHAERRRRLSAERRTDVAVAARDRGVRRRVLHEQPDHGALDVQGTAGDRRAQAHLDHVHHLYRDVRLFHRLLCGVPAVDQDPVSRDQRRHRVPGTAGRLAVAAARRAARRQGRRRHRHVLEFHRHGRRDHRRHLFRRRSRNSAAFWRCFWSFSSPPGSATVRPTG